MGNSVSKPSLTDLLIRMHRTPQLLIPPPLYHYTTRNALQGIIASNSIWATEARKLDDPSEIRYGFELAKEVLDDELKHAKAAGERSMQACLEIGLSEITLVNHCSSDVYVACFCAKPNHDKQYSRFGPYQIEVDFSGQNGAFPLTSGSPYRYLRLGQVLYDPDLQRQRLRQILQAVQRRGKEFEDLGFTMIPDSLLEQALTPWIYAVKRPTFSDEHEWRVIFLPNMNDWWSEYDSNAGIRTKLNSRGEETRYVELISNGSRLPISSICCGPNSEIDFQAEEIRRVLLDGGFTETPVS